MCLMSESAAPSERPLRRDAERNRQRILEAAHVVFAELDWTPALHRQAEDRAHRLGQTRQVKVVYFVLDEANATDRYILRLLEAKELTSKRALNRAVVCGASIKLRRARQSG